EMICIARTFGAPETVPAGKQARRSWKGSASSLSSPTTSETRCVMCENRSRPADPRQVVSTEVDEHDMFGSVFFGREQDVAVTFASGNRACDRVQACP